MKAIVLESPGEFKRIIKDHPGKPAPDQVLLKVRMLGVCGTDLHAYNGKQPFFSYPRILGHEIGAEAIEVGENVGHVKVGDQCAVMPYRNTVNDQAVKRGKTNCGGGLSVLGVHEDGAMQEYILCDAALVFPANGLTFDQIAVIEPIAIGSHAVERADVSPQDIVLVIGAGPIGIAVIMMALLKSPRIVVLDTNQKRLEFVRNKYSGVDTLTVGDSVSEDLAKLLTGNLPTIVIDATGNRESMIKCFDYVAPGGTIVYVGLFLGDIVFYDPHFHRKEITLKSSRNALAEDFEKIIRLLKSNALNIDGYITHRLAFESAAENFTKLYLPEENVIKAVIEY
jgi:2-desacetyl-2-hydroxyethyl bacteriochlorophyllide A dehydrogenase